MNQYCVLGVMSGSSLDGLDLCLTTFNETRGNWSFEIEASETLPLDAELKTELRKADKISGKDLTILDQNYGEWIGSTIKNWLVDKNKQPELIGIHGHTVFHEPQKKISLQIGCGETIANVTNIPVVDNFRTLDILRGGQGAPLVPVGEKYLFPGYEAFLNLGGICNISIHKGENIMAWDIAPCNQVFNHYAGMLGKPFDSEGSLAASGSYDEVWESEIAKLAYFHDPPPKSLSNQWTEHILSHDIHPKDALHTYAIFLVGKLSEAINESVNQDAQLLVSGGGTFNNYLISLLNDSLTSRIKLIVPTHEIVSFKEALIFGLLGLLRLLGQENVFKTVTGAKSDSVSGILHQPK